MSPKDDLPVIPFASQEDWETWLLAEHASAPGLWLKLAKKGRGIESVSQQEAVEGALCFGWIDGQAKSIDDDYWLQRYTPRRPQSKWSQKNREWATKLIKEGRMRPAGLAEVERAKADGRWDAAYPRSSTAEVPEDLQRALDANPAAKKFFTTITAQNRYAILYRIHNSKRADTRARNIAKFVAMLSRGETFH
jgi:uncharacterized protein YdeI (YjbR/CyaY-like superfamily)